MWIWLMYVIHRAHTTHTHTHNGIPSKNVRNDICAFFSTFEFENAQMVFLFTVWFVWCVITEKKPFNLPSISCNCGENFIPTLFDLCVCARDCVWHERKCDKSVHAIASSQQILKHPPSILIKCSVFVCVIFSSSSHATSSAILCLFKRLLLYFALTLLDSTICCAKRGQKTKCKGHSISIWQCLWFELEIKCAKMGRRLR